MRKLRKYPAVAFSPNNPYPTLRTMENHEHNYVHLRTEQYKYTDDNGNKCIDVRDLFFCSRCLDQQQVITTYSPAKVAAVAVPSAPPAPSPPSTLDQAILRFRSELLRVADVCASQIGKYLRGEVVASKAEFRECVDAAGDLIAIGRDDHGLNPEDHFEILVAARSAALNHLRKESEHASNTNPT